MYNVILSFSMLAFVATCFFPWHPSPEILRARFNSNLPRDEIEATSSDAMIKMRKEENDVAARSVNEKSGLEEKPLLLHQGRDSPNS
jgi:hypothetical protein